MQNNTLVIAVAACGILLAAVIGYSIYTSEQPGEPGEIPGMLVLSSAGEVHAYLGQSEPAWYEYPVMVVEDAVSGQVVYEAAGTAAPAPLPATRVTKDFTGMTNGLGDMDYSTTNVQVAGVDESDFIKNDGKYLYLIDGGDLVIVDAYPAEDAGVISRTAVEGTPSELFLSGNRLAVFTRVHDNVYYTPEGSVAPVPCGRDLTRVLVYDVRDRTSPDLMRTLSVSGNYYDGRMIGTIVYLITSESVSYHDDPVPMPLVMDGEDVVFSPAVNAPEVPPRWSYVYHTATSFDIRDGEPLDAESFLLGYDTNLYASQENMFLAYTKGIDYGAVRSSGPMGGVPTEETIIHRFSIDGGEIAYKATGDVPGALLNQFSLDEYDGNLRVATTFGIAEPPGWTTYNNVYVLDGDLKLKGKLERLAAGERIYSTRFVGDRLYMVTFKQMDPFFVVDLTDPTTPAVLGELKIPGYSDYLHPYDATHIIGIGKETEVNDWGGVTTQGLKIALFDVSDVNNPRQLDKVEIGMAGTDSEALRDHRAFLFDYARHLLVIPVSEVVKVPVYGRGYESYTTDYWEGAYVFTVTPENGFILDGRVWQGDADDTKGGSYWYRDNVRRSLFIKDALYTISPSRIVISDLAAPDERIGTVPLVQSTYPDNYGGGSGLLLD
ncbi:beta-propeller domain-containing protein [Methanovulcanius yangii]|uniref:beta-propeller domain-containing protein n=1 Tax=Methanovulcanius yangii TaxID=1789227 RepID=UPI0029C9FBEA|nr:beta-propeller domain-containing protein [Methanovulcanius yangii]